MRYIQETLKSATESVTGKDEMAKPSASDEQAKPSESEKATEDGPARGTPQPAKEGSANWQVRPDPPKESLTLAPDAKLRIPLPGRGDRFRVVYPAHMSPFVMLAGTDSDGVSEVWDLRTGERTGRIAKSVQSLDSVALSPDGLHFARTVSLGERCIEVWSFKTGELVQKFQNGGLSQAKHLHFAGPNRVLALATYRGGVTVWDVRTGKVTAEYKCDPLRQECILAVSPGGNYVAVAPSKKPPRIVDIRNGVEAGQLQAEASKGSNSLSAVALAFSPDGKELAGLFQRGSGKALIAWDLASGQIAVRHQLRKDLVLPANLNLFYGGCPPEWFSDRSGWLLYGSVVIDRKKGGPVWTDPSRKDDKARIPRRVLDTNWMLSAEGDDDSALELRLVALPKAEIAASAKVVEAGGKAADAGLPPLTRIDRWGEPLEIHVFVAIAVEQAIPIPVVPPPPSAVIG